VVTAAGHGDQLAIVSHASDCLSSGDQVFSICSFDFWSFV
jgi:chromosome transmission fidelity protein 4